MHAVLAKPKGSGFKAIPSALLVLALVVGVFWFLGNPGLVHACSCVQPGTPSEELEKFSAVFAGKVISIQHSYDPNAGFASPGDHTTVGFEVGAVWKGNVHEDMYITTPPTGGTCGFAFDEGEEYIVYAHDSASAEGGYTVGICSRTALLSKAQEDIDALGDGQAPLAGTGGPAPKHPQVLVLDGPEAGFDFDDDAEGWTVGFADLPVRFDRSTFELDYGHRPLPDSLGGSGI